MRTGDLLADLSELTLADARLRLRRAWPRGDDRLALEYREPDGTAVAAQWFADEARGRRVARSTPGSRWIDGVVVQPSGADRRLPALTGLVAEPGACLLVHRPERRAVVRRSCGVFTKVVRPDRIGGVLEADRRARATGVPMASLVGVDENRGTVDWRAAPGRSLHDLLGDPATDRADLTAAGHAVGSTVRALHDAPVPDVAPRHGPGDELRAAQRWVHAAERYGRPAAAGRRLLALASRALEAGSVTEPRLLHRDLHDKQLMVEGAYVVVLDVDTLAVGEPALDLANLLVHLELRVAQGVAAERAALVSAALVDAYGPDPTVRNRIPAYATATRARLAGLYAFRPHEHRATAWLDRCTAGF